MLGVGGDVVGGGEESGLGAELDQLRLFQYAQCAALVGGVVGEGDFGPVREIGELLVLAGVEAEGTTVVAAMGTMSVLFSVFDWARKTRCWKALSSMSPR